MSKVNIATDQRSSEDEARTEKTIQTEMQKIKGGEHAFSTTHKEVGKHVLDVGERI